MRRRAVTIAAASLLLGARAVCAADSEAHSGAALYQRLCASCHGLRAKGDGPVNKALVVPAPDLTRIAARHGGVFPGNWVYRVIDGREAFGVHGPRDMPVWGLELWREQGADVTAGAKTRDLIAELVDYLKRLQELPTEDARGRQQR